MSGGSFNYLCDVQDVGQLMSRQGDLEEMSAALSALGYAPDAARETEELLVLLRQWQTRADARIARLRGVWMAVEWERSGDCGQDDVREALAAYQGDRPPPNAHEPQPGQAPAMAGDTVHHVAQADDRCRIAIVTSMPTHLRREPFDGCPNGSGGEWIADLLILGPGPLHARENVDWARSPTVLQYPEHAEPDGTWHAAGRCQEART